MYYLKLLFSLDPWLKDIYSCYSIYRNYNSSFKFNILGFDTTNVLLGNQSLSFHTIFPVFSAQKFKRTFQHCLFDTIFEFKFRFSSKKEKNLYFLGKIFKKKNTLCLFPIKNLKEKRLIKSNSLNNFKNTNHFFRKFGEEKSKQFSLEKKKIFRKKKFISFFKNFSKISIGNKDNLFNFQFRFRRKIFNFYIIFPGKKYSDRNPSTRKILGLLKKLFNFSQRSNGQTCDFFICDYMKNKNFLKKAFFLFFFSIGFLFKKSFFISSTIFEEKFRKNFNFSDSFLDYLAQIFIKNDIKKKIMFPYILESKIKFQDNLFSKYPKAIIFRSYNPFLKKNRVKRKNIKSLLNLLKNNFLIWFKRKSYSEFRSNIFLFKFKKEKEKEKIDFLSLKIFRKIEGFMIFLMEKKNLKNISKIKNLYEKNSNKIFPLKCFPIFIKRFNNIDLDFKELKYTKHEF